MTGGWNHFHLRGSVGGLQRIKTDKKWLRNHREFEWPNQYQPENLEDLKRFYDRYLKEIRNGWEETPHVRVDILDKYDEDYVVRKGAGNAFPHPGAPGRLRVSLRELDEELSKDYQPVSIFNNPQKLEAGQIGPVDIEIWPHVRIWHKGDFGCIA